jgi:hypothetical protein
MKSVGRFTTLLGELPGKSAVGRLQDEKFLFARSLWYHKAHEPRETKRSAAKDTTASRIEATSPSVTARREKSMVTSGNSRLSINWHYSIKPGRNSPPDFLVSYECGSDDQLANGPGLDRISLWFRSEEETMSFVRRWTEIGLEAFGEVDADAMERWREAPYDSGTALAVVGGNVPDYVREYDPQGLSPGLVEEGETEQDGARLRDEASRLHSEAEHLKEEAFVLFAAAQRRFDKAAGLYPLPRPTRSETPADCYDDPPF